MMFEKFEMMFENIGNTLKSIAKILFYACLAIGGIVLIIGIFRFVSGLDEYVSFSEAMACTLADAIKYDTLYADCYYGRQMVKIGFIMQISSITTLPLYGFGELINMCSQIISKLKKSDDE